MGKLCGSMGLQLTYSFMKTDCRLFFCPDKMADHFGIWSEKQTKWPIILAFGQKNCNLVGDCLTVISGSGHGYM
jgi:hypothetical protein